MHCICASRGRQGAVICMHSAPVCVSKLFVPKNSPMMWPKRKQEVVFVNKTKKHTKQTNINLASGLWPSFPHSGTRKVPTTASVIFSHSSFFHLKALPDEWSMFSCAQLCHKWFSVQIVHHKYRSCQFHCRIYEIAFWLNQTCKMKKMFSCLTLLGVNGMPSPRNPHNCDPAQLH